MRREIADLRRSRGYSQEQLAELVGVSVSTVERWEAGRTQPLARYRQPLADLLEISTGDLSVMLNVGTDSIAPWLGHLAILERASSEMWSYEPSVIPGLLQTKAYAEAVEAAYFRSSATPEVSDRVRARMARQEVLSRPSRPLVMRVVLDESVLSRVVGSPAIMVEQLAFMTRLMRCPTISVQVAELGVISMSTTRAIFHLFTPMGADRPVLACTEGFSGLQWHESVSEMADFRDLFEHLARSSLPAHESIEVVETYRSRYVDQE